MIKHKNVKDKTYFCTIFKEFSYHNKCILLGLYYFFDDCMKVNNILDRKRLETLESFEVMDSLPEAIYDEITSLAASICNTPASIISLVDDKRQFFKSHHGLDFNGTPLNESFCKYVIIDDEDLLIVENTHIDERFANYPSVKENPHVSFYAGASLTTATGDRLGTLCVLDYKTRELNNAQINGIKTLAKQVVQLLELRKSKKKEENQQKEIERKGELLDNIVQATGIGVWERNLKDDTIILSDEALLLIGLHKISKGHIKTDQWLSLIHLEDLPQVKKKLSICFDYKSGACNIQYRIKHTNGEYIWVHENGKVLTWSDDNEPVLMYGTIQDITEKVNYSTELERLKNNQEAMIDSTQDLMWAIDLDLKLITANSAFHQLIKRNIGHSIKEGDYIISDTFDAETNNKWKGFYNRALNGESFSVKQITQDPAKYMTAYSLTSFYPLHDKEGKQIGLTCFSKDITSEILSQQVLLSAKEEMDKIMDASLDIICTVDEDGYFLSINNACKTIWGYESRFLIGKKYIDLVFKEDRKSTEKISKSIISGEKITSFENRYLHKNGSVVPILWSANWDNKEGVMYCIARDNTEKKRAEQQLEQSERRFKTLVQEGTELIAIFDQEAKFIYVSPTSKNTLKMSPEELLGTTAFDHIHLDDHDDVYAQFMEATIKRQVYIKPFRFKNGEGDWRWLETIATNQLNEPSINGIVVNTRDVTDRILHLRAIEEQNAKLKEIAWTQSHIVRAPVARLMGLINLIRDEKENLEFDEKERMLQYIIKSADEIDTVIKKIVDITTPTLDIE